MNNNANEMQQLLNKLLIVVPNSLQAPYHVESKARHEIIYTANNACVGYVRYQPQYDEFIPVIESEGVFFDVSQDYSEGYSLFNMLTGLNRTLQVLALRPESDTGRYRLWILRYGQHYVVIEMNYNKLRESVREHQFQLAFNKGNPYETLPRSSYG